MTNDDIAYLRLLADWHDRQARYLLLDIAYLRLLADWHDRQARYLLLTVPANVFHSGLPAPLSVI
jgi:hypothetical protein